MAWPCPQGVNCVAGKRSDSHRTTSQASNKSYRSLALWKEWGNGGVQLQSQRRFCEGHRESWAGGPSEKQTVTDTRWTKRSNWICWVFGCDTLKGTQWYLCNILPKCLSDFQQEEMTRQIQMEGHSAWTLHKCQHPGQKNKTGERFQIKEIRRHENGKGCMGPGLDPGLEKQRTATNYWDNRENFHIDSK